MSELNIDLVESARVAAEEALRLEEQASPEHAGNFALLAHTYALLADLARRAKEET
jgi:hypothetical protein